MATSSDNSNHNNNDKQPTLVCTPPPQQQTQPQQQHCNSLKRIRSQMSLSATTTRNNFPFYHHKCYPKSNRATTARATQPHEIGLRVEGSRWGEETTREQHSFVHSHHNRHQKMSMRQKTPVSFYSSLLILLISAVWQIQTISACANINVDGSDYTTWERFTAELNRGVTTLNPFIIEGDGCPQTVEEGTYLTDMVFASCCEDTQGCVINCPHAQIVVQERGFVDLFSFTWKNSESTALTIRDGAYLFGSRLTFINNGQEDKQVQGGAIHVEANAFVDLENCAFESNQATEGGAVYNEGFLTLNGGSFTNNQAQNGGAIQSTMNGDLSARNVRFESNQATLGGGALWTSAYADLSRNKWQNNKAGSMGGAVLDVTGGVVNAAGNEACGNQECDGVTTLDNTCVNFAIECKLPTPAPSLAPTLSPTVRVTEQPSLRPSTSPRPSLRPSKEASSMPSNAPTLEPSESPSATESELPSLEPSLEPSLSMEPSMLPSELPSLEPSMEPSMESSLEPSREPSPVPSMVPTLSPAPTGVPSDTPSRVPTFTPSDPPSSVPSDSPSTVPTFSPTTNQPTPAPSAARESELPTIIPTLQ